MLNRSMVKVIGYRWVSSRPSRACPECSSLDGQEFFFHPQDGQRSVADMPAPPLHPNCRCTRVEMVEFTPAALHAEPQVYEGDKESRTDCVEQQIKPYMEGVAYIGFMKLIWRHNALLKGPIYGRYGGKQWSYGRDLSDGEPPPDRPPDPEDDMDAIFAQHDRCYDMFEEVECDRQLVKELEGLADDPRMWRNPPATEYDIAYARRYRKHAIWLFRRFVRAHDLPKAMRESLEHEIQIMP